ncbi:polysaccharide deacetylase family protein [Sulfitobacter donghicola]|uniref:Polysaccharide deacetylase n=1 Tax=Sulfitobacter donghicola DSW-25 = KCTC 12864 = JCM 14565 TaxID=1300350 RepID=A0A073IN91_9RHOB|nr:polysaccharide deacetylase family protein [Sulfitobacter donghicola]KEJ90956.1 polysaccharide deacetylase [Sulfitobacter donghicola DSW-25 = KCTC 12864 = JCM 14565]KIN68247.1 Glycosyltransferase 28 domain protein [Sulfitobacter donghicola DSW-25 = KCTC 12864 = JCM 14565]
MADWAALNAELARWDTAGLKPVLWWRDDDAQTCTPALERLLGLSDRYNVPAHISVIPQGVQPDLAARLRDTDYAYVLQHGLQHKNHEPKGLPASEVGDTRPMAQQQADLALGWSILQEAELPRLLPALVPPWNRIGDATRALLPDWGYTFMSAYEGRGDASEIAGLTQIDAHLDPIRWKYDRVFRGTDKMLAMLIEHLHDRRTNDPSKPIGYVTHHLQTHDAIWDFTDQFFQATKGLWASVPDMLKEA